MDPDYPRANGPDILKIVVDRTLYGPGPKTRLGPWNLSLTSISAITGALDLNSDIALGYGPRSHFEQRFGYSEIHTTQSLLLPPDPILHLITNPSWELRALIGANGRPDPPHISDLTRDSPESTAMRGGDDCGVAFFFGGSENHSRRRWSAETGVVGDASPSVGFHGKLMIALWYECFGLKEKLLTRGSN